MHACPLSGRGRGEWAWLDLPRLPAHTRSVVPLPLLPLLPQLVKVIKASGPQWVSKYARGGSARKLSARKVYVVVDAVQAHFATDGLAPLPRPKLAKLVADVAEARQLLSEGK